MGKGVFVITGGGRGIGAAIALDAGAQGWHVLLTYTTDEGAAVRVSNDIRRAGGMATCMRCDAGRAQDVAALFAAATAIGPVDVLVFNGGITGGVGRLDEQDDATLARVVEVNLTGAMLACRDAVRIMSTRHGGRGGSIVLISSLAARLGAPNQHVWYAATKGGVDSFALGLASEVAAEGIRVNVVSPGPIETGIHAAGHLDRIRDKLPMQRIGTPAEVAAAVMFVVSDGASYVSGAKIEVGGAR